MFEKRARQTWTRRLVSFSIIGSVLISTSLISSGSPLASRTGASLSPPLLLFLSKESFARAEAKQVFGRGRGGELAVVRTQRRQHGARELVPGHVQTTITAAATELIE